MKKDVFPNRFRVFTNIDYVIRKGDSLYKIAQTYNVSVQEIMALNNLQSTLIYPNQIIVIPHKGVNKGYFYEEYVITPNDNFELIARRAGVGVDLLMKANDYSKLKLEENQVLRIPTRSNP
ncbi:MAG: LysM peptidoglycan-binding domain-containing protein [Bacilli bacterium]|nr:LysM peptidoglycan-binding domain-containing protein [Bacilli bacterium]